MRLRRQFLTQNDCYRAGRTIRVKGVMVHSTGANNPLVSRYVPGDDELGRNRGNNHWDRPGLKKCVHAFLGKFADGEVGVVQTLPWDRKGWHSGSGSKAVSANSTHIGFEICEDGLDDPVYFGKVYREAVELVAMLCGQFGLDPLADGVVICHAEGHKRGVASNHGDVLHWFPGMGKSMDDFRADVARELKGDEDMDQEKFNRMFDAAMERYRQELRDNDCGDWSREARQFAVEQKIFSGGGAGPDGQPNYMWEDLLTREQAAQLLYAFARRFGLV